MLFSSPLFLFLFLPLFFTAYFAVKKQEWKNIVIFLGSCLFYAWGEPKFIFVILFSILLDWYLGRQIYQYQGTAIIQKRLLLLAIITNLGLLAYFKYMNFFIDNLNWLLSDLGVKTFSGAIAVVLPLGISFIVFEKITYIVDIYKGISKPAKNLMYYALYILMFPKLLAGPIVKYHDIEKQLECHKYDKEKIIFGLYRFALGLAKKTMIADTLAIVSDSIFQLPTEQLYCMIAWVGIICFTLQIFFDFSGYSDMAIGLAAIMGFTLRENFNHPYIALSITEFWRRWHISLSTWIKEYLYIPLGGNRYSLGRSYINLIISFLASGLWHGANWTFIVWGMYHGLFLIIDRLFWLKTVNQIPKVISLAVNFLVIMIGWVIFRAADLEQAFHYIQTLFALDKLVVDMDKHFYLEKSVVVIIIYGLAHSLLPAFLTSLKLTAWQENLRSHFTLYWQIALSTLLLILSMAKLADSYFVPFLYFRF